jgi:acetyltransferase-like isoleucine patch superfamily enzyme
MSEGMKTKIKWAINAVFVVINLPLLALYFLLLTLSSKASPSAVRQDELFAGFSQFYALWPGKVGVYLRRNFYRFTLREMGPDVTIGFGTLFSHRGTEIGANVYIGPQCNIGLCRIGSECLIGSGVHILSGTKQHHFDGSETPLREQGGTFTQVNIGENCWLGNCALVMGDVAERSVIGAGALVVKSETPGAVLLGHKASVRVPSA